MKKNKFSIFFQKIIKIKRNLPGATFRHITLLLHLNLLLGSPLPHHMGIILGQGFNLKPENFHKTPGLNIMNPYIKMC